MTPRRRLSNALTAAARTAVEAQRAQNELHEAFEETYGIECNLDELEAFENVGLVDALVYGAGMTPSLKTLDRIVAAKIKSEQGEYGE